MAQRKISRAKLTRDARATETDLANAKRAMDAASKRLKAKPTKANRAAWRSAHGTYAARKAVAARRAKTAAETPAPKRTARTATPADVVSGARHTFTVAGRHHAVNFDVVFVNHTGRTTVIFNDDHLAPWPAPVQAKIRRELVRQIDAFLGDATSERAVLA